MILHTFRAPVGEPFGVFCILLGSLFEVLFLTLLRGTEYQRVTVSLGVWGP